jgi:hypothetical protein
MLEATPWVKLIVGTIAQATVAAEVVEVEAEVEVDVVGLAGVDGAVPPAAGGITAAAALPLTATPPPPPPPQACSASDVAPAVNTPRKRRRFTEVALSLNISAGRVMSILCEVGACVIANFLSELLGCFFIVIYFHQETFSIAQITNNFPKTCNEVLLTGDFNSWY